MATKPSLIDEAVKMAGETPKHATEDLYDALESGDYPEWTVYVQIMTPEEAKEYKFDPFDITKVWYHGNYPLIPLGKMVINRAPENFFAEGEQAAFAPSNFVPGIGPSPDRLLQGRLFSYEDTQRHRLGPNHHQIPVNRAKNAKIANYQRDGPMTMDDNGGSGPNYYPNTMNGPEPDISFNPPVVEVQAIIDRHTRPTEDVDFVQAGELYRRVLDDEAKTNLVSNIADHLFDAKENIQYRQASLFYKCDVEYGTRGAESIGLDVTRVKELVSMTQEERVEAKKS
ncbi:MAG: catalase [Methanobacteriaceae archaeon]|nr:catalase [Methanobacteriaceae archaeon]